MNDTRPRPRPDAWAARRPRRSPEAAPPARIADRRPADRPGPRRALPRWPLAALALGLLCTLPACRVRRVGGEPRPRGIDAEESALIDRLEREREHARLRYDAEKLRLELESESPRAIDLDGLGSLIVHRVELLGGVDRPYLRARFTYVNTSGRRVPLPTVELVALSPAGRPVLRGERFLERTLGSGLEPDTAYTAWVDADIGDLYLAPGWDWSMDVRFED